jgi:arginase
MIFLVTIRLAVLGVPTSAGAYAPGQELAPQALREHALLPILESAGWQLRDLGDLPTWRWRPDPQHRFAQNLDTVVGYVRKTAERIAKDVRDDESVLVLGGDCTVGLGTLAAYAVAEDVLFVYFDMHADLNVPDSTIDGALDWMGVAHALGDAKALPELCHVAAKQPLIRPDQLVLLGFEASQATDWERQTIDRYGIRTISAGEVTADPTAAARSALRVQESERAKLVVHFDVDVIDFVDAPLSENTGRNVGISLTTAGQVLATLAADPRFRAVTITELNPLHGAEDGSTLERFVETLGHALSRRT